MRRIVCWRWQTSSIEAASRARTASDTSPLPWGWVDSAIGPVPIRYAKDLEVGVLIPVKAHRITCHRLPVGRASGQVPDLDGWRQVSRVESRRA